MNIFMFLLYIFGIILFYVDIKQYKIYIIEIYIIEKKINYKLFFNIKYNYIKRF